MKFTFLRLRIKDFRRSPVFTTNLVLGIIVGIYAFFLAMLLPLVGFGTYYMIEEMNLPVFESINKYIIYLFATDLMVRFLLQKFNSTNLKALLLTPVPKTKLVKNILLRSAYSIFNILSWLYIIPLVITLLVTIGYSTPLLLWSIAMVFFILFNNYLNLLLNKINAFFYSVLVIVAILGFAQYMQWFDITNYSGAFYRAFYDYPLLLCVLTAAIAGLIYLSYKNYLANLYLDKGLQPKQKEAQNLQLGWLDKFGSTGTFLKLDIKMLLRNKRAKSAMLMSFGFVFYGLLFFMRTGGIMESQFMIVFASIFVTGGFTFVFGNYIPSWDSSYYPFMMTQRFTYFDYLKSKWWLMVIATAICSVLALFYVYFGWHTYLMILSCAVFNIGVNTHLVMLSGAFVKTPINLSTNQNLMGDKKAFNIQTVLLALPKLLLPVILYGLGLWIKDATLGYLFIVAVGVIGLVFRNYIFKLIEKVYKQEKYSTIAAYKTTN